MVRADRDVVCHRNIHSGLRQLPPVWTVEDSTRYQPISYITCRRGSCCSQKTSQTQINHVVDICNDLELPVEESVPGLLAEYCHEHAMQENANTQFVWGSQKPPYRRRLPAGTFYSHNVSAHFGRPVRFLHYGSTTHVSCVCWQVLWVFCCCVVSAYTLT